MAGGAYFSLFFDKKGTKSNIMVVLGKGFLTKIIIEKHYMRFVVSLAGSDRSGWCLRAEHQFVYGQNGREMVPLLKKKMDTGCAETLHSLSKQDPWPNFCYWKLILPPAQVGGINELAESISCANVRRHERPDLGTHKWIQVMWGGQPRWGLLHLVPAAT